MADIYTPARRSEIMAGVRSHGNERTEVVMARLLHAHGITGWRRQLGVFGKPDFVFRREKVALFVDGCFWHSCPKPKHASLPKTRADWWQAKLTRNRDRDKLVNRTLRKAGWKVLRIWQCDLRGRNSLRAVAKIQRALAGRKALLAEGSSHGV